MQVGSESGVWVVEVELEETSDTTEAKAVLTVDGHRMGGWGRARRNPDDPELPRVGEELAAARALSDLAHQLVDRAAELIELVEGPADRPHL
jgi:hypothetical protein